MRHWRERGSLFQQAPGAADTKPLTIAIARERGAGGRAIAEAVANQLGWPLYDQQLVDQIAEDTGVRAALLEQLDEHRPHWLSEIFQGLSEEKQMTGAGYAIRLHRVLLAVSHPGECVILGRGAAQLLPEDRTLRVALVAPREYRIGRLAERFGGEKEAAAHIDQTDTDRIEFVKQYYHKDPTDLSQYDLCLDTSAKSLEECVDEIVAALNAKRSS